MRWFHTIWVDGYLGDRRGLIVERHANTNRIASISLLLSARGFGRRLFLEDFGNVLVEARPEYWLRVTYFPGIWPKRWGLWWGVQPVSGDRDQARRCPRVFVRVP